MSLRHRLRAATAAQHNRLEGSLDLLAPPLTKARFLTALSRFWGFHHAWEPAVTAHTNLSALFAGRGRLDLLRGDLMALGLSGAAIEALPDCPAAAALAASPAAALGSLYVIEGSTMGGQVIARALAGCDWAPTQGLRYFLPYGAQTGERWRAFEAVLNAAREADEPAIERTAIATFEVLHDWMAPDVAAS